MAYSQRDYLLAHYFQVSLNLFLLVQYGQNEVTDIIYSGMVLIIEYA